MLKFVYSFFLGLLLVVFVGMGVASFYPSPKAPEYPIVLETNKLINEYSAEERAADQKYQTNSKQYTEASARSSKTA